jgi:ribonuclease T2
VISRRATGFFDALFQYPTYKWLQKAGIVPSNTTTYAKTAIVDALTKASGAIPHIACKADGSLNEVWYYRFAVAHSPGLRLSDSFIESHSLGAPQFGLYKPLNTTFGNDNSCPDLVNYFKRAPGSER